MVGTEAEKAADLCFWGFGEGCRCLLNPVPVPHLSLGIFAWRVNRDEEHNGDGHVEVGPAGVALSCVCWGGDGTQGGRRVLRARGHGAASAVGAVGAPPSLSGDPVRASSRHPNDCAR